MDDLEKHLIRAMSPPDRCAVWMMAALKDRGQHGEPPDPLPAADRPLEQWEQDWIAEVQRRREQMGGCAT